jgi:hypothetical protein
MAKWEEILEVAVKSAAVAFVGSIMGQVAAEVLPQPSQLPQFTPTTPTEEKPQALVVKSTPVIDGAKRLFN